MQIRIITHGGCTDGFCSAFIVKKYATHLLGKEVEVSQIIGISPRDVQDGSFVFEENDVVVDLPRPSSKVLFWCDHHLSAKPEGDLAEHEYWKQTPSCSSYLLEIAYQNGLKQSEKLDEFTQAIDTVDDARFSREDIALLYYEQDDYTKANGLLQLHMLSAIFNTRDRVLNDELFLLLLSLDLGESVIHTPLFWEKLPVEAFHKARLKSFALWREKIDEFIRYDEKARCVIQDNRGQGRIPGVVDRFYAYMKFDEAAYGLNTREIGEDYVQLGLGSNIFHKERCKLDIGALCREVANKFGEGVGGGHFAVGGCTVLSTKADEAIAYVLEKFASN